MANKSEVTTDRETIRKWAEDHGGRPSRVKTTGDKDPHKDAGLLRIDFKEPNENFEEISWDDFFQVMEDRGLAMIIQHEHADGSDSTFNRFVRLEDHPEAKGGHGKADHAAHGAHKADHTKAGHKAPDDHAKNDHPAAHEHHGSHAPHHGHKGK